LIVDGCLLTRADKTTANSAGPQRRRPDAAAALHALNIGNSNMNLNASIARLARAAAVTAAAIASNSADASATTVDLSWSGVNGYSAIGSFTYDRASAPAVIIESGAGATKTVQSFSITFFDPAHTVLESGSAVIAGVSSDRFFQLTFNTLTSAVSVLDGDIGGTYIYFLTDLRTPTGSVVPAARPASTSLTGVRPTLRLIPRRA